MVTVTKLQTPAQDEALKYCSVLDINRITNMSIEGLTELGINRFVKTASGVISNRVGGKLGLYEIADEEYSGNYHIDYMGNKVAVNYLQLNNINLSSITNLQIEGVSVTPSSVKIDGDTIYLTEDSEVSSFPTYEIGSVVITYQCGNYNIDTENIVKLLTQTLASLLIMRTPQGRNLYSTASHNTDFGEGEFDETDYEDAKDNLVQQVKYLFQEIGIQNIDF